MTRKRRVPIWYDGELYPTFGAFAAAYGVDQTTLRYRLNKGIPIESALSNLKGVRLRPTGSGESDEQALYTIDGRPFASLSAIARTYNVSLQTLHNRVKRRNWTLRQAVGLDDPPPSHRFSAEHAITLDKTTYRSRNAVARAFGVSPIWLTNRTNRKGNVDLETALYGDARDWKDIDVNGVTYRHLGALAAAYDIDTTVLYKVLDRGNTLADLVAVFERHPEVKPRVISE